MTESELLSEEIAELEAEIMRLKGSMNRADNGVKLHRLRVANRTLERLKAISKREAAA